MTKESDIEYLKVHLEDMIDVFGPETIMAALERIYDQTLPHRESSEQENPGIGEFAETPTTKH